jgi:hypothetical protein
MRTRTLATIATGLIATGLGVAAVGLTITGPGVLVSAGALLSLASPPVLTIATRQQSTHTPDLLAEVHNAGYRKGLAHAALGLLESPTSDGSHTDTDDPERKAE